MSLRPRVLPLVLLQGSSLVKTTQFRNPRYVGDPVNTVRTFCELEVDELCVIDIHASRARQPKSRFSASAGGDANPELAWDVLSELASEALMPLVYGGGVRDLATMERLLRLGFEKVLINSAAHDDCRLVEQAAARFGSQAVVVGIDVRRTWLGRYQVRVDAGSRSLSLDAVGAARRAQDAGAGELLVTAIDREGTWAGGDVSLVSAIAKNVHIPTIAHGGVGHISHIAELLRYGGASAVAVGSMAVYQNKDMGVLVNFPSMAELDRALAEAATQDHGSTPFESLNSP